MAEEFERRPAPATPYVWNGQVLSVSVSAVEATLRMLHRFGPREACAFWYGDRASDGGQVQAVLAPRQHMERTWYDVRPQAMSEMAEVLRDTDWRPLAQIHSHPGPWVEHSLYDDRMVSTKRALSLVIPNYGRWRGPWPIGMAVHEYAGGYWHMLTDTVAARRVRLEPACALRIQDLRP